MASSMIAGSFSLRSPTCSASRMVKGNSRKKARLYREVQADLSVNSPTPEIGCAISRLRITLIYLPSSTLVIADDSLNDRPAALPPDQDQERRIIVALQEEFPK